MCQNSKMSAKCVILFALFIVEILCAGDLYESSDHRSHVRRFNLLLRSIYSIIFLRTARGMASSEITRQEDETHNASPASASAEIASPNSSTKVLNKVIEGLSDKWCFFHKNSPQIAVLFVHQRIIRLVLIAINCFRQLSVRFGTTMHTLPVHRQGAVVSEAYLRPAIAAQLHAYTRSEQQGKKLPGELVRALCSSTKLPRKRRNFIDEHNAFLQAHRAVLPRPFPEGQPRLGLQRVRSL